MIPPTLASNDLPEAIELQYERTLESIEALSISLRERRGIPPSFLGLTADEADAAIISLRAEIDRQMSLALIAAFEATLRIDCFNRIHRKLKSGIGPKVSAHRREFAFNARLEDILDLWKEFGVDKHKVGDFKKLLERRHWLAHGRYWDDRTILDVNPNVVRQVADTLFKALDDFPAQ